MSTLEQANTYRLAGISVIPIGRNKRPDFDLLPLDAEGKGTWKPFESRICTEEEAARFFANGAGIGIVCGPVSGGIVVLDFDRPGFFEAWRAAVDAQLPGVLADLPEVRTPSGMRHVYARTAVRIAREILAQIHDPEDPHRAAVAIEVRGTGHYVVAPGSPASCHPDGKTYDHIGGPFIEDAPALDEETFGILLACARALNRFVAPETKRTSRPRGGEEHRAAIDFNRRGDVLPLLERHGWEITKRREDGVVYLRRPGKDEGNLSATFGYGKDREGSPELYVFSTNGHPFRAEAWYSQFDVLVILEHRGDVTAALEALTAEGYGADPDDGPAPDPDTDAENARRLADAAAGDFRFVPEWGTWAAWTGRVFERDDVGRIWELAKRAARGIYHEAAVEEQGEARERLAKWAKGSHSETRLRAMVALARSVPGIPLRAAELDRDPWMLNCPNGVVDLRTGDILSHERGQLLSKLCAADFDPSASSAIWEKFLADATGKEEDLLDFIQRAAGYSATGDTGEEVLFFVHGPGAAGKSTFIEAVKYALGTYAMTADFETFLKRSGAGGARNDVAQLSGARLVSSIEVERGRALAVGLVKMLTGGDTVRARFLYQEHFEFKPAAHLWLVANHAPKIDHDDSAIWRRILKVPFTRVVPREDRDPGLKGKLREPEAARAILAWLVRGAVAWRAGGLRIPACVATATEGLRAEMDALAEFFDERCTFGPGLETPSGDLRKAYVMWAEERKERPVSNADWGAALEGRGCSKGNPRREGKRTKVWIGVELHAEGTGT